MISKMFSCFRWNIKLDSFGVVQKIEELHHDRRIFVNMRPEYEWKNLQEKMKYTFRGEYEILSESEGSQDGSKKVTTEILRLT
jgi:hypothetical protein